MFLCQRNASLPHKAFAHKRRHHPEAWTFCGYPRLLRAMQKGRSARVATRPLPVLPAFFPEAARDSNKTHGNP